MTTPGGHPDYQDYSNWRGPIYANTGLTVTLAAPFNVTEFVTNFATTYIFCNLSLNNGWTVTITWFTDATKTQAVYQKTYVMRAGETLSAFLPNVANFLQVNIGTGQGGTMAGFLYIAPMNNVCERIHYPMQDNNLSQLNVSIAANSSQSFLMPYVMEGNGLVNVSASAYTGGPQISVVELNEAGVGIARPLSLTNFTAPASFNFTTPPNPCTVQIVNNDAAAHTYTFWAQVLDN